MEAVHAEVVVSLSPEEAFRRFTERAGRWWPKAFTWSQETLVDLVIEPRAGGRCFEEGPHGFRCDFGRVLEAVPGERLVFTWQIDPSRAPQPDPQRVSRVEVRFGAAASGEGTQVEATHDGFERHGEGAAAYRDGMAQGWRVLLDAFARAAGARG